MDRRLVVGVELGVGGGLSEATSGIREIAVYIDKVDCPMGKWSMYNRQSKEPPARSMVK